jgi:hypothetical protein
MQCAFECGDRIVSARRRQFIGKFNKSSLLRSKFVNKKYLHTSSPGIQQLAPMGMLRIAFADKTGSQYSTGITNSGLIT